jgi:hypothetical protein
VTTQVRSRETMQLDMNKAIVQSTSGWRRVRLNVHGANIYRWRGTTLAEGACRRPLEVEAFEREPQDRALLGRWFACPNVNVRARIAKECMR